jgi:hypothetical protein
MQETPERISERLFEEGQRTIGFFKDLNPENWDVIVYIEAGQTWTVQQVLAHFLSTEQAIITLISNVLAGGEGAPERMDIDAFNAQAQEHLAGVPRQVLLDQFQAERGQVIALLKRLTPADLSRPARHPFLGATTLLEVLKLLYRHNQIHQRDIRRSINARMNAQI